MRGADVSVRISVSVRDDHLDLIDEVVRRLEGAGVKVDQVLRPLGVITGSAPAHGWRAIGQVAGVASVEAEREVRLPPPDADVQ
jgi:hypothetical protein